MLRVHAAVAKTSSGSQDRADKRKDLDRRAMVKVPTRIISVDWSYKLGRLWEGCQAVFLALGEIGEIRIFRGVQRGESYHEVSGDLYRMHQNSMLITGQVRTLRHQDAQVVAYCSQAWPAMLGDIHTDPPPRQLT